MCRFAADKLYRCRHAEYIYGCRMCKAAVACGTPCPQDMWRLRECDIVGEKCLRCIFMEAHDRRIAMGPEAYQAYTENLEREAAQRDAPPPPRQSGVAPAEEVNSEETISEVASQSHRNRHENSRKPSARRKQVKSASKVTQKVNNPRPSRR
jgi:hypothetical protein